MIIINRAEEKKRETSKLWEHTKIERRKKYVENTGSEIAFSSPEKGSSLMQRNHLTCPLLARMHAAHHWCHVPKIALPFVRNNKRMTRLRMP